MSEILNLEQFEDLRKRSLAGEQLTREELRAAISYLRQDRMAASQSAKTKGKEKSTVTPIDINALFAPKEANPS